MYAAGERKSGAVPNMSQEGTDTQPFDRNQRDQRWLRISLRLVIVTMLYNSIEAVVAVASGFAAGSIALFGFDPGSKAYRSWWFNSEGNRNESEGSWNEKSQTLSYLSELDDGKRMHTSIRFAEPDKEQWQLKVTDTAGKVPIQDPHLPIPR